MTGHTRQTHGAALVEDPRGLVSLDGRSLPLLAVRVQPSVAGSFAQTLLVQRYRNPYQEPLEVLYTFPLPVDGAVVGYTIRIGQRVIEGEVRPQDEAKEEYRRALLEGRLTGLLEEERGDTFTQQLGNLPPGAEAEIEIRVIQPLAFLPRTASQDARWEYRFPTVVGVRYMGDEAGAPDADRLEPGRTDSSGTGVLLELAASLRDAHLRPAQLSSPTHQVMVERAGNFLTVCARETRLDRDIVLHWPATRHATSVDLLTGGGLPGDDGRYGILSLTPPQSPQPHHPRDVILLIDASGSMSGQPLSSAKAIATSVLESLGEGDSFEILAFASSVSRLTSGPQPAEAANLERARAALDDLEAGGATEMVGAIVAAIEPLAKASQRQVILITDGYIGFEKDVVEQVARRAAKSARVHTVGVGVAPCRALTQSVARAGAGVEVLVTSHADTPAAAANLVAACAGPQITNLTVSGTAVRNVVPHRPGDLLADRPAMLAVELEPAGGSLVITGDQADAEQFRAVIEVPPMEEERTVVDAIPVGAIFGREAVADLEAGLGDASGDSIEALGMRHRIATSQTSLVAVSEDLAVDPRDATRRERLSVELPQGVSAEGVGFLPAPSLYGPVDYCDDGDFSDESFLFDEADDVCVFDDADDVCMFDEADDACLFDDVTSEPRAVARRLLREGDLLVLEVDVREAGWQIPAGPCTLLATLDRDRHLPLILVPDRSTRPGPVAAGTTVRIGLRVPADLGDEPFELSWEDAAGNPVVRIEVD